MAVLMPAVRLCLALLLLAVTAATASPSLPVRVPLHPVGHHVAVALRIYNGSRDANESTAVGDAMVVFDTSSADLIVRNVSTATMPRIGTVGDSPLFFDGEDFVFREGALREAGRVALLGAEDDEAATAGVPLITAATFSTRSRLHRAWSRVGGILGAAYPGLAYEEQRDADNARRNSTFLRLLRRAVASAGGGGGDGGSNSNSSGAAGVFALDVEPGRGGELHLGAPAPSFAPSMRWSEAYPLGPDGRTRHEFPMFHLSLCGNDLFSNYSSQWPALVDTGAACLTLPGEFFDMVMAWAPSECWPVDPARTLR